MAGNPADQGRDFDRSPENLKAILRETFRLKEFRDNQLEAINATFEGKDVFVVGDNGAGKSLCYQLPACLSAGVTVVISPLIKDQIQNLTKLGIVARTLSGDKDCSDADSIYQQLSEKDPIIKLLYVTPKKVRKSRLLKALQDLLGRGLLARFVIDEAQCISQKAFRKLINLLMGFPGVPMIALSAPVRDCIKVAILKELKRTKPEVFTMSLNRTNLKYAVMPRTTFWKTDCITWIMEHYPRDSGIVYCWRRDDCDNMAASLNGAGLQACSYHSGMSTEDREIAQNMWRDNIKCQVICVTTKSFGLGLHKPDVRYVIHTFLPWSVENYYQQSGLAGRDGNLSHCILFYKNKDRGILSETINNECRDYESRNRELATIGPMVEYCQNTVDCRRQQLLAYFGWGDIEANVCLPNSEAICDNCERANAGAAATR